MNSRAVSYAENVLSGKILVCEFVKQAAQQFLDDLQSGVWIYRPELVERVVKFCELLPVGKGPLAGQKIRLMDWQHFVVANLYGFTDATGARRFRQATIYVPRGNGKSGFCSALALYALCADGEKAPEVYSAAVKVDQAKIVWSAAEQIVKDFPDLRSRYGLTSTNNNTASRIKRPDGGVFIPLSSEAKSLLGLNTHFACCDEIASHPKPDVYQAIRTSISKRRHPLIMSISTATGDNDGIGKELWDYGVKILNKEIEDDRHFTLLYTIDDNDDPYDPAVWRKANPSWGITVQPDGFAATMLQARQSPAQEGAAFTFHLNKWITTDNALFSPTVLNRCIDTALKIEDFKGQHCTIGIDLAYRLDLTGLAVTFSKSIAGKIHYYTFAKAYLNEDAVKNGWNQRYPAWSRDGLITVTPGNTTDWDYMLRDVVELSRKYVVDAVLVDRWKAAEVISSITKEGLPAFEFPMNVASMSSPTREFELAYTDGRFHFDGNPVFAWNVGCVVGHYDAAGNVFPKKNMDKKTDKVDLFIATAMTIAKVMEGAPKPSVYEQRGILTI